MLDLFIQKYFIFFLLMNLLFQGFLPLSANSRKTLDDLANVVLVKCSDSDHSHPPMIPSTEEKEANVLYLNHQNFSQLIRSFSEFRTFQVSDEEFWNLPFLMGRFNDNLHLARAPPLVEV